MLRVISASRRVRKTGAVPVFGFTRAKCDGARGKHRSGSFTVAVLWRKNAQGVSGNLRSRAAEHEGAELEPHVHVLEEYLLGACSRSRTALRTPSGGDFLEEGGSGLVGVDSRGREEANDAVGPEQPCGALDEQGVEVDVCRLPAGGSRLNPGPERRACRPFA